ncbi:transposase-like zinc-binding domain-containing protein [Rothia sp. 88186D007BW]
MPTHTIATFLVPSGVIGRKVCPQNPTCLICNQRTRRNGTTSAGTTRYRCTHCGASRTIKRPTSTRKHQLATFIT